MYYKQIKEFIESLLYGICKRVYDHLMFIFGDIINIGGQANELDKHFQARIAVKWTLF